MKPVLQTRLTGGCGWKVFNENLSNKFGDDFVKDIHYSR